MKKITLILLAILMEIGVNAQSDSPAGPPPNGGKPPKGMKPVKAPKEKKAKKAKKQVKFENETQDIYMFGFSGSFTDSVVYLTDIQLVKDVQVQKKTGFLVNRNDYSNQLKQHLENQGAVNPTCVVCFDKKRKNAESKLMKYRKRYAGKTQTYILKTIPESEFRFENVTTNE